MNVSEVTTSKVDSGFSPAIKVNDQTIRELRTLAKERRLYGYCGLRRAELVSLFGTSLRPEPGKSLSRAAISSRPDQMGVSELREKTRSAARSELSEWHDFLKEQAGRDVFAAGMCPHLWEMTELIELLGREEVLDAVRVQMHLWDV